MEGAGSLPSYNLMWTTDVESSRTAEPIVEGPPAVKNITFEISLPNIDIVCKFLPFHRHAAVKATD